MKEVWIYIKRDLKWLQQNEKDRKTIELKEDRKKWSGEKKRKKGKEIGIDS